MPGLVESSLFSPLSHTCDTGHVKNRSAIIYSHTCDIGHAKNWSTIIYHNGSKSQYNDIKSTR